VQVKSRHVISGIRPVDRRNLHHLLGEEVEPVLLAIVRQNIVQSKIGPAWLPPDPWVRAGRIYHPSTLERNRIQVVNCFALYPELDRDTFDKTQCRGRRQRPS
jgi:hypothetical protein